MSTSTIDEWQSCTHVSTGICTDCYSQRAHVELVAEAKCCQRFPIRYQDAQTDRPDVTAWSDQFRAAAPHDVRSLLLLGPTGTGKTYQAYAALRRAVTTAIKVRSGLYYTRNWQAMTYADLCASLRPHGRDYDPEAVFAGYLRKDILLIDDLGAAKTSDFVEETTYRLINSRYNDMKPTIYTTNLALPDLKDAVGDRIASRLAEDCVRIVLDGPDRRRQSSGASAPVTPEEK